MRITMLSGMLFLAATAGCARTNTGDTRQVNFAKGGGLGVSLELPNWQFTQGEKIKIVVTAKNLTSHPLKIETSSGAPVIVRLSRHTVIGWEELLRYPKASIMVMNRWTLGPKETKRFPMLLKVEPDWPVGELLRMTGELNGRSEVAPGITIGVNPAIRELTRKKEK